MPLGKWFKGIVWNSWCWDLPALPEVWDRSRALSGMCWHGCAGVGDSHLHGAFAFSVRTQPTAQSRH